MNTLDPDNYNATISNLFAQRRKDLTAAKLVMRESIRAAHEAHVNFSTPETTAFDSETERLVQALRAQRADARRELVAQLAPDMDARLAEAVRAANDTYRQAVDQADWMVDEFKRDYAERKQEMLSNRPRAKKAREEWARYDAWLEASDKWAWLLALHTGLPNAKWAVGFNDIDNMMRPAQLERATEAREVWCELHPDHAHALSSVEAFDAGIGRLTPHPKEDEPHPGNPPRQEAF